MERFTERLVQLLIDNVQLSRGIKQIYDGDPWFIPKKSLPSISVDPVRQTISIADTQRDQDISVIQIRVIFDARDFFNSNKYNTAKKEIAKIMQERVSGNSHELKENTVFSVVRQKFWADKDYNLRTTSEALDYQISTNREFPTIEGVLSITVESKLYNRAA